MFIKKNIMSSLFQRQSIRMITGIALLQIDNQPERFVAGLFDNIDATTSVFVGLDRRDEPVAPTSDFLKQMAVRNGLYLGDTDRVEAIEHWSMAASRKAIKQIKSKCA